MERDELIVLFYKYRSNKCSPEEVERLIRHIQSGRDGALIENLIADFPAADHLIDMAESAELRQSLNRVFLRIQQHKGQQSKFAYRLYKYYAAAAVLVFALITWYFVGKDEPSPRVVDLETNDIAPGGNRAMLTLANGQVIPLSEEQLGIVIGEHAIFYQDQSNSAVILAHLDGSDPSAMLSLSTPKGGTYQIQLPDSTKVWLNAGSTLTYPSRFSDGERRVTLSGEGYFAVKHDAGKTFSVASQGQILAVLGTQFNVMAYPDDNEIKTTLVQGIVRLGDSKAEVTLRPGEQSALRNGTIQVKQVDVDTYVGWKDGEFVFNGIELREAMKQLGRWYDVEIVYEGDIPPTPFYGSFSRSLTLSATLAILKEANVNFSVYQIGSTNHLVVRP